MTVGEILQDTLVILGRMSSTDYGHPDDRDEADRMRYWIARLLLKAQAEFPLMLAESLHGNPADTPLRPQHDA